MPSEALTVRATLVAGIVATKVAATRAFMRRSISDRRKVLRYAKKILHQRYAAGINIMFQISHPFSEIPFLLTPPSQQ